MKSFSRLPDISMEPNPESQGVHVKEMKYITEEAREQLVFHLMWAVDSSDKVYMDLKWENYYSQAEEKSDR